MNRSRRSISGLVVTAWVCCIAAPAFSHGDKARNAAAARREQKPWGIAGDTPEVTRTIVLRMTDRMRFEPDRFSVRVGETVRLVVRNDGRMLHELVIGTPDELDAHAELMKRFPDMEHDEPWMVHVPPGASGRIVWTFNRAGTFAFACLMAGHYQAGMVGRIDVRARGEPVRR